MLSRIKAIVSRIRGLFNGRHLDGDFEQELESHLALLAEENIRAGMSPEEARRMARLKLGGAVQLRESHHKQRTLPWLESIAQDTRFGLRVLRKNPGFTAVAILTLALGIGVNTTLFSAYNAVALKPLPVADPAHVARFERWFTSGGLGSSQYAFSYPEYIYCRDHATAFSALVASSELIEVPAALRGSVSRERLDGQLVSANYFTGLGIRPQLGRPFASGEDQKPGGDSVVVISDLFWQRAFNSNPQTIGQVLTLKGVPLTIVGIAPKGFTGTTVNAQIPDFWAPLSMQAQLYPGGDWLHTPDDYKFEIYARLKNSVTRLSAEAETSLLIGQFSTTYTPHDPMFKTRSVTLPHTTYFPNTDDIRFRASIAAAMLIIGFILFVACVNVGNMLLARGAARQREISTRRALGAGRARIIRQLVIESLVLAFLGGVAGLLVSVWAGDLLHAFLAGFTAPLGGIAALHSLYAAVNFTPDTRVMIYALVISICAGTLLGLSPALQLTSQDLVSALKSEGPSMGALRGARLRNLLIAAQVAASVFLLASAGLLVRGLIRSQAAEPGFDTRDNFWLSGDFGGSATNTPAQALAERERFVKALRTQPEFAAVTFGSLPLNGTWTPPMNSGHAIGRALASTASETYFDLLRIPFVRGRGFTEQESENGAAVAVISESTARQFWPQEDALGKTFSLDMNFRGKLEQFQVIGIVKDVRFTNLTRVDPAHVYLPVGLVGVFSQPQILVKIYGDVRPALTAAQTTAASVYKTSVTDVALVNLEDSFVALQRTLSRTLSMFAAGLAALALTLTGVGIYGVLSYLVSQRSREIGIRIALGASPGALLRNIVVVALRPVFAGIFAGLAAAAAFSTLLHQTLVVPGSPDFFYGVRFYDPVTFVGLFLFALLIAALASAVPARRAMRVDPMVALRYE
jgi:predicted permease